MSCPGFRAVDKAAATGGSGTAPAESLTITGNGEMILGLFEWNAGGGAGTVRPPFTELTQYQTGTSFHTAVAYSLQSGAGSISAEYTIASAVWRAITLSFVPKPRGLVGAYIKDAAFGTTSTATAIADWVSVTSEPLPVRLGSTMRAHRAAAPIRGRSTSPPTRTSPLTCPRAGRFRTTSSGFSPN